MEDEYNAKLDEKKSRPLMITLGLMVSFVIVCACIIVFLIVTKTFNKRKKLEDRVTEVIEHAGSGDGGGDGSYIYMDAEIEPIPLSVVRRDSDGGVKGTTIHTDKIDPLTNSLLGAPGEPEIEINGLVLKRKSATEFVFQTDQDGWDLNGYTFQKNGTNYTLRAPSGKTIVQGIEIDDSNSNHVMINPSDGNKDVSINGIKFNKISSTLYQIQPDVSNVELNGLVFRNRPTEIELDTQGKDFVINGTKFKDGEMDTVDDTFILQDVRFTRIGSDKYSIEVPDRELTLQDLTMDRSDPTHYSLHADGKDMIVNDLKLEHVSGTVYRLDAGGKALDLNGTLFRRVSPTLYEIDPQSSDMRLNGLVLNNSDVDYYTIEVAGKNIELNGLRLTKVGTDEFKIEPVGRTDLNLNGLLLKQVDANTYSIGAEGKDIDLNGALFNQVGANTYKIDPQGKDLNLNGLILRQVDADTYEIDAQRDDVNFNGLLFSRVEDDNVYRIDPQGLDLDLNGAVFKKIAPNQYQIDVQGRIMNIDGGTFYSLDEFTYMIDPGGKILQFNGIKVQPDSPIVGETNIFTDTKRLFIQHGMFEDVDNNTFAIHPGVNKSVMLLNGITFDNDDENRYDVNVPDGKNLNMNGLVIDDSETFLNLRSDQNKTLVLSGLEIDDVSAVHEVFIRTIIPDQTIVFEEEIVVSKTLKVSEVEEETEDAGVMIDGVLLKDGLVNDVDVAELGNVVSQLQTTVGDIELDLEGFPQQLKNLTVGEIQQLENIGTSVISSSQWVYLSQLDQSVSSSSHVEFGSVTTNVLSVELIEPISPSTVVDINSVEIGNGTVDGVDIATFYSDYLDLVQDVENDLGFPAELKNLTTFEIQQLTNIGFNAISSTQWNYLSTLDQSINSSSSPDFASVTTSSIIAPVDDIQVGGVPIGSGLVDGVDISQFYQDFINSDIGGFPVALKDLTEFEILQLQNINANAISETQWGYLSASDQSVSTTSSPQFASISTDTISDVAGNGIMIDGVLLKDGLVDGIDISDLDLAVGDHESRLGVLEPVVNTLDTTTMKLSGDQTAAGIKTLSDLLRAFNGIDVRPTSAVWPMNLRAANTASRDQLLSFQAPSGTNAWYWTLDKSADQHIYLGRAGTGWTTYQFRTDGDLRASTFNGVDINALSNTVESLDTDLGNTVMRLTGDQIALGIKSFPSSIKLDQIDEYTSGAGVSVDGVLLKDGVVQMSGQTLRFKDNAGTRLEQVAGAGIRFWRGTDGTLGSGNDDRIAFLYDGYLGLYRTTNQMRFHDPADTTKNTYFHVPLPTDTATTYTISFPSSTSTLATTDDLSSIGSNYINLTDDQIAGGVKSFTSPIKVDQIDERTPGWGVTFMNDIRAQNIVPVDSWDGINVGGTLFNLGNIEMSGGIIHFNEKQGVYLEDLFGQGLRILRGPEQEFSGDIRLAEFNDGELHIYGTTNQLRFIDPAANPEIRTTVLNIPISSTSTEENPMVIQFPSVTSTLATTQDVLDLDGLVVKTSGNQTIDDIKSFTSSIKVDQIDEYTEDAGVTVDGVLLHDSWVITTAMSVEGGSYIHGNETGIMFLRATDDVYITASGKEVATLSSNGPSKIRGTEIIFSEAVTGFPIAHFSKEYSSFHSNADTVLKFQKNTLITIL